MTRSNGSAVSRRGIHAQVVDAVGRRIVTGELAEGEVLDLAALEAEFDVSHTALREAIKVLTAKSLVDARPKLGTYVVPQSSWNLLDPDVMAWRENDVDVQRELAGLRLILDAPAAALAARNATPGQVDRLRQALTAMEESVEQAESDPARGWNAAAAADAAFHLELGEATGNKLLAHFERLLLPALQARHLATLPSHHGERFIVEHRAVLDAVSTGDEHAAHAAMKVLVDNANADFESRHPTP